MQKRKISRDHRDDDCDFQFDALRLSHGSVLELRRILKHFEQEVRELSRRDLDLPPEETQWYRLFVAARLVPRKELLSWR